MGTTHDFNLSDATKQQQTRDQILYNSNLDDLSNMVAQTLNENRNKSYTTRYATYSTKTIDATAQKALFIRKLAALTRTRLNKIEKNLGKQFGIKDEGETCRVWLADVTKLAKEMKSNTNETKGESA